MNKGVRVSGEGGTLKNTTDVTSTVSLIRMLSD